MKSTAVILTSLLASVAVAQPYRKYPEKHDKRDDQHGGGSPVVMNEHGNPVVMETAWESVYETVPYTTTIWVTPGGGPPAMTTTTSSKAAEKSTDPAAANLFEPADASTPTTTSSSAAAKETLPAPSPADDAKVEAAPVVAAPAPVAASADAPEDSPPAYIPDRTTKTPTPTTTTAAAPPAASTDSDSGPASGSSSNLSTCTKGKKCTGKMSNYTTGMGACGWTNDGLSEAVLAWPAPAWPAGPISNGNPICGQMVTISRKGKSVKVKVVDKCPGCEATHLDLSEFAFKQLLEEGEDMIELGIIDADWYLVDN